MRRHASASILVFLLGCHVWGGGAEQRDSRAVTAAASSAAAAASAKALGSAAPAEAPIADWREAARRFQWKRAHELLAALPESERDKPEIRLARARIAIDAGEPGVAVEALAGLEKDLPLLKDEIRAWYAEAAALAGPHEEAAKILQASPKVVDLVTAAEAYERADQLPQARAVIDKAIKLAERTRRGADEELAHAVRARIAEKMGKRGVAIAAADWRWVALHGDDDRRVRDAIAGIDRVGGHLRVDERLEALARSTHADNLDETLATIDELGKKNPGKAIQVALARARSAYAAREWARARSEFEAAAKLPSGWVPEAKYYGARSAVRSADEKAALAGFEELITRFRTGIWAERALYRKAQLLMQLGRYEESAAAFAQYHTRYGSAEHTARARYGHAVALLSAGKAAKAKPLLTALRRKADNRREEASLQHLEALAAHRAGDEKTAVKLWLELARKQPLTWPALAARARLERIGHAELPPYMPEPPAAPHTPLSVKLPPAPALLQSLGLDLEAESRLARMEQEAARAYAGRESEALCTMYASLSCASRRHYVGSRAVSFDLLMKPPSPAERWTWSCVYPGPYSELVSREEERHELPAGLVHAVMRQESAFKPQALSPVGAQGLMQLMPATARKAAAELGLGDIDDVLRPDLNVKLGAFYLGKLLETFQGSVPLAAAAYNAGPRAVDRWLAAGDRETDLWVARIPYTETRHYVERVLTNLGRYQWLAGGNDAVTGVDLELPKGITVGDDAY